MTPPQAALLVQALSSRKAQQQHVGRREQQGVQGRQLQRQRPSLSAACCWATGHPPRCLLRAWPAGWAGSAHPTRSRGACQQAGEGMHEELVAEELLSRVADERLARCSQVGPQGPEAALAAGTAGSHPPGAARALPAPTAAALRPIPRGSGPQTAPPPLGLPPAARRACRAGGYEGRQQGPSMQGTSCPVFSQACQLRLLTRRNGCAAPSAAAPRHEGACQQAGSPSEGPQSDRQPCAAALPQAAGTKPGTCGAA